MAPEARRREGEAVTLLTPADVAAELGVSPRTVRRLLRGLVVVRVGRSVRVERAELDKWIRSQRERWASGCDGAGLADR